MDLLTPACYRGLQSTLLSDAWVNGENRPKLSSISVGRFHHSLINHDFVLFIIFVQLTTTLMYALCLYIGYAIDAHPRNATIMA